MAVIVKYVVVRDGDEKMTFATKKEADAHDKMLDIAENMYQFLKMENLDISPEQLDVLSLHLAKNKDAVLQLLKGGKLPAPKKTGTAPKPEGTSSAQKSDKSTKKETQPSDKADDTDGGDACEEDKKKKAARRKKTA